MVRQVPRYETGIKVVEHALQSCFRIDAAMSAGHLPHAVQETTDAQIGGELHLAFYGYGHISLLLLALVYADCGKQTVPCLPHPNKTEPASARQVCASPFHLSPLPFHLPFTFLLYPFTYLYRACLRQIGMRKGE